METQAQQAGATKMTRARWTKNTGGAGYLIQKNAVLAVIAQGAPGWMWSLVYAPNTSGVALTRYGAQRAVRKALKGQKQ